MELSESAPLPILDDQAFISLFLSRDVISSRCKEREGNDVGVGVEGASTRGDGKESARQAKCGAASVRVRPSLSIKGAKRRS